MPCRSEASVGPSPVGQVQAGGLSSRSFDLSADWAPCGRLNAMIISERGLMPTFLLVRRGFLGN